MADTEAKPEHLQKDVLRSNLTSEDKKILTDEGFVVSDDDGLCVECGRSTDHWISCWVPGYNLFVANGLRDLADGIKNGGGKE